MISTCTPTNYVCGQTFSAYPPALHTGSVICANTIPSLSSNALRRIEGSNSDGTIFEGCIVAGPRNITTSSGETHPCDGTNDGAYPTPGTTPTDQPDAAAAMLDSFSHDGLYSGSFSDFDITSIRATADSDEALWALLVDFAFVYDGSCTTEVGNGDATLFAFNPGKSSYMLKVEPEYAVVAAGSTLSLTITGFGGDDGDPGTLIAGASIAGLTSDVNGNVAFTAPTVPGCYQYKATYSHSIGSNAFYLTVV